jgi:hypothetical protein
LARKIRKQTIHGMSFWESETSANHTATRCWPAMDLRVVMILSMR